MRAATLVHATIRIDKMRMILLRPRDDVLRVERMQNRRADRAERRKQGPQQGSAAEPAVAESGDG